MPLLLFIAFVVVPLLELVVLIQVGSVIGAGWTILLLVLDSLLGAYLVKREGRRAWTAFREAIDARRWPGDEVTQGALVLVGGALLLTPGFVTDALGLAMLLPPTRALLSRLIRARVTPPQVRVFSTVRAAQRRRAGGQRAPKARPTATGATPDVEVVSVERDEPPAIGDGPPAGRTETEDTGDDLV